MMEGGQRRGIAAELGTPGRQQRTAGKRLKSLLDYTYWVKLDHRETKVGSSMNERHASLRPATGHAGGSIGRSQQQAAVRFELSLKSIGGVRPSQNRGWQTSEP